MILNFSTRKFGIWNFFICIIYMNVKSYIFEYPRFKCLKFSVLYNAKKPIIMQGSTVNACTHKFKMCMNIHYVQILRCIIIHVLQFTMHV